MNESHSVTIRRFEPADAEALNRLILEDLMQVNVRDYGETAVEQLARFYTPELLLEYARQGETYVALEGSNIVGTATLDQNRVRNVFVRMDHHKGGIGRLLMQTIEESAARLGQARLVLSASLFAVDFYLKLGYDQIEEKEDEIGGERMKMVLMEKMLLEDGDLSHEST